MSESATTNNTTLNTTTTLNSTTMSENTTANTTSKNTTTLNDTLQILYKIMFVLYSVLLYVKCLVLTISINALDNQGVDVWVLVCMTTVVHLITVCDLYFSIKKDNYENSHSTAWVIYTIFKFCLYLASTVRFHMNNELFNKNKYQLLWGMLYLQMVMFYMYIGYVVTLLTVRYITKNLIITEDTQALQKLQNSLNNLNSNLDNSVNTLNNEYKTE